MKLLSIVVLFFCASVASFAANIKYDIVVAKDGSGQFSSIEEAIESLPMYCYDRTVIFIKNGVYNEKLRIDRDYVTLIGEDKDSTRVEFNQVRSDWDKNPDNIGPAVVNIFADDIVIKNLTIENTQPKVGPHAFAIYGTGNRTILKNCNAISKGGDTVSLWNYKHGMYYHDNCHFEGAVDFVCPRGWCYISNSTFVEQTNTAAIWHAAPTNPNQKFVLENCDFQGVDSFYLARHHYDAQFYLLNCTFPSIMQNKPILHVTYPNNPSRGRPYLHGDRYYFYNCHRTGGDFSWFTDNNSEWPENVSPSDLTPAWTFEEKWNPVDSTDIKVSRIECTDTSLYLYFNELVMNVGSIVLKTESGKMFNYVTGSGRDRLEFSGTESLTEKELKQSIFIVEGEIQNIYATVNPRLVATILQK